MSIKGITGVTTFGSAYASSSADHSVPVSKLSNQQSELNMQHNMKQGAVDAALKQTQIHAIETQTSSAAAEIDKKRKEQAQSTQTSTEAQKALDPSKAKKRKKDEDQPQPKEQQNNTGCRTLDILI